MKIKFKNIISSAILAVILAVSPIVLTGCRYNPGYKPVMSKSVATSFGGRSAYEFANINNNDVVVESFYNRRDEGFVNNPNIGQAVMLNDAIRYKQKYPNKEVYASITSFHFSVVAAVCLDETSEDYLKVKSLYDCEYDDDGYVRIAYLAVKAAMVGINIIVIGQIDANNVQSAEGVWARDLSFEKYFTDYLTKDAEVAGKKIGDFMTFKVAAWTSYGDKAAVDMMHLKTCTVSNYRDYKGNDHGPAVWLGCINIDGIDYLGRNGNNNMQTAVIITEHEILRKVLYNYTELMVEYCEQEEINEFRNIVNLRNKEQIDLIEAGRESEIDADEQIVYLGSKTDPVFELYLTPLADSINEWDTKYNPYCKYLSKLHPDVAGDDAITLSWISPKFKDDSEFSKTVLDLVVNAFTKSANIHNKLYLHLTCTDEEDRIDYSMFNGLVVGENIGFKITTKNGVHSKDIQLSYVENGERQYVSIMNTLNFHQGASGYQANSFLIIKENKYVGNNFYVDLGVFTTQGAITEADRIVND